MTKQIDIKELIPFMKDGWVAMDKNNRWFWYDKKPETDKESLQWLSDDGIYEMLDIPFDIAPTDDWTKSLIKVRTKMEDRFKYKVWHKRKELPKYRERTIVYVFDDGVDVEDYCLAFFYAGNLKKWAYWEDVQKAVKYYEELKDE